MTATSLLRKVGGRMLLATFGALTFAAGAYASDDRYYNGGYGYRDRDRVVYQQPYRYRDDYDGYYTRYRSSCGYYGCARYRYSGDRYRGYGYRDYGYGERRGYDYGRFRVCDRDGDRCYASRERYWDYRTYYRIHGYRWIGD